MSLRPKNGDEDSEPEFIDVMNTVMTGHLSQSYIVRVHRVGQKTRGKTRPLTAKLAKSSKKIAVLKARPDSTAKRFDVSGDSTPRQRDVARQARNDNLMGSFSGGKFHTKLRSPISPAPDSPTRRSPTSQKTPRQGSGQCPSFLDEDSKLKQLKTLHEIQVCS